MRSSREQVFPINEEDNSDSQIEVFTRPTSVILRKRNLTKAVSEPTQYTRGGKSEIDASKLFSVGNEVKGINRSKSENYEMVELNAPHKLSEQEHAHSDPKRNGTAQAHEDNLGRAMNNKVVSSESSDSESSRDEDCKIPTCTVDHSVGRTVLDCNVQTDVFTLFNVLFSNSKFIQDLQDKRETINAVMGEWTEEGAETVRRNTYYAKVPVKIGPKYCKVSEKQVLLPVSKPGYLYAIDMESNNSEVPNADSFYLTVHFCLTRVAPKESHITAVANLFFRKWTPLKSFIERGMWGGLEIYYTQLHAELKREFSTEAMFPKPVAANSVEVEAPISEISQQHRRPLRKKRPAPAVPAQRTECQHSKSSGLNIFNVTSANLVQWRSDLPLKILLCTLTVLLLSFNIFLFLKVQELETALDKSDIANFGPKFSPYSKDLQIEDFGQLLQKNEDFRAEQLRWLGPVKSALEKLMQIEQELLTLKTIFILNDTHKD